MTVAFNFERNRLLNDIELVATTANQVRLTLATEPLADKVRTRAEESLAQRRCELKKLTALLRLIDARVNVTLTGN